MNNSKKNKASKAKVVSKQLPESGSLVNSPLIYVLLFLSIIIYFNTLSAEFTNWDDNDYITNNPLIQNSSFQGFIRLFSAIYSWNYHPLTAISNWLEFKFFGLNPKIFHFNNILLHTCNVYLVYLFVRGIKKNQTIALFVAAFFAVHPMHVESVAWASERKDLLYTLFVLLGLIQYSHYLKKQQIKHLVYAFLLFVPALLSKSAAVIFPLLLLCMDYYQARKFSFKMLMEKVPFLALSIVFGIVAMHSQEGAIHDSPDYSVTDRFFLVNYSYLYYIVRAFVPINLSVLHAYPAALETIHYLAPIGLILLLFLYLKLLRNQREAVFGILFYTASVLLVIQIIPVGKAIVAERYSYLSYIGILFAIGQFYLHFTTENSKLKKYVQPIVYSAFVIFCLQTMQRNKVWKNSFALWQDAIEKNPKTSNAYLNLGNAHTAVNEYEKAIKVYSTGLSITPDYTEFLINRGNAKKCVNDLVGAIDDFSEAIKRLPNDKTAYFNRGATRNINKEWKGALEDLNTVIKMDSMQFQFYVERGLAKDNLGDLNGALLDYNKSLALKNDFAITYLNRGIVYFKLNRKDDACADWKTAQNIGNPQSTDLLRDYCK